MIRFSCPNCETNLKTADEKAGTKILCPECKERVLVPTASGAKAGAKAAARPKPDAQKSQKGLVIGLAAAACVLVAGGGILVGMQFMGDKPKETKTEPNPQVAVNQPSDTTPPVEKVTPSPTATTPSDKDPSTDPAKPAVPAPGDPGLGTTPPVNGAPPIPIKTPPPAQAPDKVVKADPEQTPSEAPTAASLSAEKNYQRLLHSTTWIVTLLPNAVVTGSGGLIDRKNKLVLTNEHVIAEFEKQGPTKAGLSVFFPEYDNKGQLIAAQKPYREKLRRSEGIAAFVVAKDVKRDLALVQLTGLPENAQELQIANKSAVQNQRVYSIGNPNVGALWIPTQGNVRQVFTHDWVAGDGKEFSQHHANVVLTDSPINSGDSGGPVVNDRKELVAVVHGNRPDLRGLSLFIDVTEVRAFINGYYKKQGMKPLPEATDSGDKSEDVPTLAKALKHPDVSRRVRAASLLRQIGVDARAAVPALLEALKDPNEEVRKSVADALDQIGVVAQSQVPAILEALKENNLAIRESLLGVLKQMGPEAESAIPALIAALKDPEKPVRKKAATVLAQMGPVARAAVPALAETLKDSSPEVRAEAAATLAKIGPAALPALAALGEALKDTFQDTRLNALKAIAAIGPEAKPLVPALDKALKDRDLETRIHALLAVGAIGPDAQETIPNIIPLLDNEQLHSPVADALVKIGKPALRPLVGAGGLGHPKWVVRLGAAKALRQFGSDAKGAVAALTAHAQRDDNPQVRKAAQEAVDRITGRK
jgi:HEAT repeat protein